MTEGILVSNNNGSRGGIDRGYFSPWLGVRGSFLLFLCLLLSSTLFHYTVMHVDRISISKWSHFNSFTSKKTSLQVLDQESSYLREPLTSYDDTNPVAFAIYIQSSGNAQETLQALKQAYHPRNTYAIHMDLKAPQRDFDEMVEGIRRVPEYASNVIIMKRTSITYSGITLLLSYLTAMNTLLDAPGRRWDFFTWLSPQTQILVPMEDILEIFNNVPRFVNFIEYKRMPMWAVDYRVRGNFVDEGLWKARNKELETKHNSNAFKTNFTFRDAQYRDDSNEKASFRKGFSDKIDMDTTDEDFRLYKGNAHSILSREFSSYLSRGYDGAANRVLLLLARSIAAEEAFFQTVAMNSGRWRKTVASEHWTFHLFNDPGTGSRCATGMHSCTLLKKHLPTMYSSGALFAHKFSTKEKESVAGKTIVDRYLKEKPHEHVRRVCQRICLHLHSLHDSVKPHIDFSRVVHPTACGSCVKDDPKFKPTGVKDCPRDCSHSHSCPSDCWPNISRDDVVTNDARGHLVCLTGELATQWAVGNPLWSVSERNRESPNVCTCPNGFYYQKKSHSCTKL